MYLSIYIQSPHSITESVLRPNKTEIGIDVKAGAKLFARGMLCFSKLEVRQALTLSPHSSFATPRKCLGFKTSAEVFASHLQEAS